MAYRQRARKLSPLLPRTLTHRFSRTAITHRDHAKTLHVIHQRSRSGCTRAPFRSVPGEPQKKPGHGVGARAEIAFGAIEDLLFSIRQVPGDTCGAAFVDRACEPLTDLAYLRARCAITRSGANRAVAGCGSQADQPASAHDRRHCVLCVDTLQPDRRRVPGRAIQHSASGDVRKCG